MKKEKMLTVRLTSDILDSLDELAHRKGTSRATMARNILANCERFDEFLQAETAKGIGNRIRLEEDLARQVQVALSVEVAPAMAPMIAEMMRRVMEQVARELSSKGAWNNNSKVT